MSEDELDLEMRRQIRRAAVITIGSSFPVIALFVTFAIVLGPSVEVISGIVMLTVIALAGVDLVARFPRPRPAVVDGAVELRGSRLPGVVLGSFGVSLAVATAAQLSEPDVFEQRRALLLLLGPPVGVLFAVVSVALLLVPGGTRVGPETLEAIRPGRRGGRPRVAWDDVEGIGIPAEAEGTALTVLPVAVQGSEGDMGAPSAAIAPTVWVLIAWLEHYRQHPQDRGELAGPAGIERLVAIEERLATGARRPRWFAPPADVT